MSEKRFSLKCAIGMYGISVNKKIIVGKRARKKLNDSDEARIFNVPFLIPLKKNFETR